MVHMPQLALATAALGIGFAGSLHCVGMCGPFAALVGGSGGPRGVVVYSAGRLLTYAALGTIAGALGSALLKLRMVGVVAAGLLVVAVALQLAGVLPEPKAAARLAAPIVRAVRQRRSARFLLGASTALLPCGLVYAAMGVAVGAGSPLAGAAVMIAFGVGTTPALVLTGTGFRAVARMGPRIRRGVALGVAIAGLWAVAHRAHTTDSIPAASDADVPACCRGIHGESP